MYEQGMARAQFDTQLPDCLQEGLGFDITHRAADLHDGQVRIPGPFLNTTLDLIGIWGMTWTVPPR